MLTEKFAAVVRAIKARTIYPDGHPVPSDHTHRLRSQWLNMAAEFGLQSQPLDPRRDDFGFTTLDELSEKIIATKEIKITITLKSRLICFLDNIKETMRQS
jgi:hypothetical protein